jgi:alpha-L-fucosidase
MREEDGGGDVRRGVGPGSGSGAPADGPGRRFEGTWESLRTRQVPVWFDDAKLGIFIHWGLYSVPGWAPRVPDIQQLLVKEGPKRMLRENPYAEWYRNTMRIPGSPTQLHHTRVYGEDYPYDNFVRTFDDASSGADLDALADLCRSAGARYVVLTTKHHDGFALWPSNVAHPVKGAYRARRDLVGDLSEAVRARRMRMGLYYSGGYDWPYNDAVLSTAADAVLAAPHGRPYVDYVTAHVRELIDRYAPSVLWNDIGWPGDPRLPQLFADYYNAVEEGVINDRWKEPGLPRNAATDALVRALGAVVQAAWSSIPERRKHLTFAAPKHYDFRTPEYDVLRTTSAHKWELARGVGHSFGANRHERPEDIISETVLVQMFCDIVAKNGNLLLGIGPRPDGTIPDEQQAPLRGLGAWLDVNGEAIYGSRPWVVTESVSGDGTPLRFTKSGEGVYALLLGMPRARQVTLRAVDGARVRRVRLVGADAPLEWSVEPGGDLSVTMPARLPLSPVTVLDLGTGVRARLERA